MCLKSPLENANLHFTMKLIFADILLVSSNLEAIITLLNLSKAVFRRIKFNFAWAMVYNMIALPVAAGVLYPIGGRHIRLDPVWASK